MLKRALLLTTALLAVPAFAQDDGFSITIGDEVVAGDVRVATTARRVVPPFRSTADVTVVVDGLGVRPRLELEVTAVSDTSVMVQSRMNYPGFVTRGEVQLWDRGARGDARLIDTVALGPNGTATLALPDAEGLVVIHRVYDGVGRYDETAPLSVRQATAADGEQGIDAAAIRRIPVQGGAVTVRGKGLSPGATVSAFGEVIRPDSDGDFVLQRILPAGERVLPVRVTGAGENLALDPVISIPTAEWFTVATGDLTVRRVLDGPQDGETRTTGRLAYYTRGRTVGGWTITSSADTGEGELEDLFRDFDEKDPASVIERLNPDFAYPTYGDDSELLQDAPTDGKFYFRAERDGSSIIWGNFKGALRGGEYLRNERTLYGFQGIWRTPGTTSRGEAQASVTVYAAQPDQLPGREAFLGTGGSVYFLRRQDIAVGSDTVMIEVRDPDTGRVIEQRRLVEGRDYRINYLQGVVVLTAPLSATGGTDGVVRPAPGDTAETRLVVSYEYTPTSTDVDGFAYGGRVEGWVADQLRFGVTGLVEQTDLADQRAIGADLRYVFGQRSFVEVEAARTEGPGFGTDLSNDGGLTFGSGDAGGGTGRALRFKAEVDFADLGMTAPGALSVWAERRTEGFSTLDHSVDADERLAGFSVAGQATERLSYKLTAEDFASDDGDEKTDVTGEVTYKVSDRVALGFGLSHQDRVEPGEPDDTGRRTDLAAKITFTPREGLEYYVFGQSTVARAGGLDRNDRLGVGAKVAFAQGWTAEGEVSDGSQGAGGKAILRYERDGSSAYFGYTLDPGRELDGVTLNGRDKGQFVLGGRRPVTEDVTVYGENTYDMFGQRTALTSTYGVDYKATQFLNLTGGLEVGRIRDDAEDFDRRALSFGVAYADEGGLSAKGRLEYRQDRGIQSGSDRNADVWAFTGAMTYEVDEARRWIATVDHLDSTAETDSLGEGDYTKATLGYAYRPVNDDRLNLLFRYTYLRDMYGQTVDGEDDDGGPRQKSHVFSVDATWQVNSRWEVGGKLGYRLSETSPDDTTPLQQNDAGLAVLNARYHLTQQWDVLVEGRYLTTQQAGIDEFGALATVYRHFGDNLMVGVGYNFGSISDDLTDLTQDDQGVFLNIVAQY